MPSSTNELHSQDRSHEPYIESCNNKGHSEQRSNMLIKGASKLIRIIKEKDTNKAVNDQEIPVMPEGPKLELQRLEQRLDASADSLNKTYYRLNLLTFLVLSALILAMLSTILTPF